jgi:hypothetical protein
MYGRYGYLKLLSEVLDHVSKPHQISALNSLYSKISVVILFLQIQVRILTFNQRFKENSEKSLTF